MQPSEIPDPEPAPPDEPTPDQAVTKAEAALALRRAREAAALRDNLRRRKQQGRRPE